MTLAPFVQTGSGSHPTIDRGLLLSSYPDLPDDVWSISSASDLVGWERLRERHGISDPNAISCDLFVWGAGAPPDPRLTRVGGVPWLPKATEWPRVGDSVTTFLCQFDFRDSRDLVGQRAAGKLPGDILLVFAADQDSATFAETEKLRFLWVSAGETDVISAADVPTPTSPFRFVTAWGARFRTVDVPSRWDAAYEIPKDAARGRSWRLPVLWGTKIGGVPYDSQENLDEVPPNYLCQLTSIQASSETSWPWVDQTEPLVRSSGDNGIDGERNQLMLGDMGELTLYVDESGVVSAGGSCG